MSKKERGMSDIREALVALLWQEGHAPMSAHDPRDGSCQSCPWPLHEMPPEDIADAILAEFDVTTRGVHNHGIDPACPETRLPDGSLRGECMSDYTPTEAQVRSCYGAAAITGEGQDRRLAGFDRLMAEIRREAAEKAWDKCWGLAQSRAKVLRDGEPEPNPYARKDADHD